MEREGWHRPRSSEIVAPRKELSRARVKRRAAYQEWKDRRAKVLEERIPKYYLGSCQFSL